ncbi:MAG: transposase [Leptospirales bacterium]
MANIDNNTRGKEIKSNITDNESGQLKSNGGWVQGYNGMAMVDAKSQVITYGEAFGGNNEGQYFRKFMDNAKLALPKKLRGKKFLKKGTLLADTAFFSEDNLKYFADEKMDVCIPDHNFRKRDLRFVTADRHKDDGKKTRYTVEDFEYNKKEKSYICPNGVVLKYKGEIYVDRSTFLC